MYLGPFVYPSGNKAAANGRCLNTRDLQIKGFWFLGFCELRDKDSKP